MARENHRVNAGAPRPHRPRCAICREAGTAWSRVPLPARRGRHRLGAACPRVPLSTCAAQRGQGEGWGLGWRALAYRAARPKGAVDDGERGAACGPPPLPCECGRLGPGRVPSRALLLRVRGGEVKGEGTGRRREGGGGVPLVLPSRAYGAVHHGGRGGADGDGEREAATCLSCVPSHACTGWCALVHLPSAPMGKGGTRDHVPLPTRTGRGGHMGQGERAEGDGERGRRAPRVGRGWRALACTLPMHVWGGVPSYTTLPRAWGRVGPGIACPFPCVQGGAVTKGKGRCAHANGEGWGWRALACGSGQREREGAKERDGGPSCAPFPRKRGDGERWWQRARALPFHADGTAGRGGRGGARRGERHPLVRPLSARTGATGRGGGGVPVCCPSTRMGRRDVGEGEGPGGGNGVPSCAPFLRERGQRGEAAAACPCAALPRGWDGGTWGKGRGPGEGNGVPSCAPFLRERGQRGEAAAACPCAVLPRGWDGGMWGKGRGPEGGNGVPFLRERGGMDRG
ncbi:hypothetical protein EDB83DRAFT_2316855 [Lactarius deliciosus]|nr:hypothetical protein EDB83DRAFT_2316855 [Lactarius deliciosus]